MAVTVEALCGLVILVFLLVLCTRRSKSDDPSTTRTSEPIVMNAPVPVGCNDNPPPPYNASTSDRYPESLSVPYPTYSSVPYSASTPANSVYPSMQPISNNNNDNINDSGAALYPSHPNFLQPAPLVTTASTSTLDVNRAYQDEIQDLQFSSHPRPKFATVINVDENNGSTSHVSSGPEQPNNTSSK